MDPMTGLRWWLAGPPPKCSEKAMHATTSCSMRHSSESFE